MTTTLSGKGQLVVPALYRKRLGLREGTRFHCQVKNGSLVFTPNGRRVAKPRLVLDKKTGLWITMAPPGAPLVTSEQVRAALEDFP